MAGIESESDLRRWLRDGWDGVCWGPLIWVEAARGGTVGAPDVFVPDTGLSDWPKTGFIPVELKYWPRVRPLKKIHPMHALPTMRASQRRLHIQMEAAGLRSAVLAYIGFGEFALERGGLISKATYAFPRIGIKTVEDFRLFLLSDFFWEEPLNAKLARASSNEQQRKEHRRRASKAKSRV